MHRNIFWLAECSMNRELYFHRTQWKVKLSSKWTNSIKGPPSLWVPHLSKWVSLPLYGSWPRKRQHRGLQHLQSVSLWQTKTFTRKWCKSRRRKKCCCSSLKPQLRGRLCSDNLLSHLSMWANRASAGSKHDKWHIEKVKAPSAPLGRSTLGAYGDENRDETSVTLYFVRKKKW